MLAPCQTTFENLKKDDLLSLGKHLKLDVRKTMRKDVIQHIVMKHSVSLKLFEGSVLESLASSDTSDIEIRKLELELELRKFDAQKERELRELEFKERELREREKEREARIEKQRLDHELEMKKLEMQEKLGCSHPISSSNVKFDVSKYIKLVPPFHEADVDKYFLHFEKVAQNLEWPKKHWPMLLQSVLVGKAREIYTQLSVEQALDYDSVKQLILKGYELVPEAYRQKFRNQEKGSSETYVEFARTKIRTDKIYHDVDVGDATPVKQHPYRLNPAKQKYLHEEIKYLLENDFIEPSKSNWNSPCILVPKPDGTYRMCTDYRKVNNVTKSDRFPIPRMDDCIDRIGPAKYVTKFDLLKGFWQVPLTDRAKEISAFVTPDGLFQYNWLRHLE